MSFKVDIKLTEEQKKIYKKRSRTMFLCALLIPSPIIYFTYSTQPQEVQIWGYIYGAGLFTIFGGLAYFLHKNSK